MYFKILSGLISVIISAALTLGTVFAGEKPLRITQNQSRIVVKMYPIPEQKVHYYYLGWDDDYSTERYAALHLDNITKRHFQFIISILVNSELYWSRTQPIEEKNLKRIRYLRNKEIRITKRSKGVDSQYDTKAGGENYVLFLADKQSCLYVRKIPVFGEHGGTATNNYAISGIYCAPVGKTLTEKDVGVIMQFNVLHIAKPIAGHPKS